AFQVAAMHKAFGATRRCAFIGEPVGKNTAPAIACAAALLKQRYGDAVMVVLPADHSIGPAVDFRECVRFAADLAQSRESLVIFGIPPAYPETGYGYIQRSDQAAQQKKIKAYSVLRFVEKPSANKARAYIKSGRYFWNSGIFVWKVSVILDEIKRLMPVLYSQVEALARKKFSARALNLYYRDCEKQSIDYGVMEKARRVLVVGGTFAWDDVGSWEAMGRIHPTGPSGTTIVGGPVFERNCRGSIIVNKSGRALAACGLDHLVLVATDDAVLAIDRRRLPAMRQYVAAMKAGKMFPKELF
ncbi:MAG: sugar phosphate nucleotidyltransferase, partial [Chitinivibrionales bacterium]|nr:sugar phosphate nucleotidyltransferase [Chitinivibrionales bacterium]